MKRVRWLWWILAIALVASCGSSGGPGSILSLVQDEDEPGRFQSELLILDAAGREVQRIRLPSEPTLRGAFAAQMSSRAMVQTAEDGWCLIDTARGTAEELDIPLENSDNLVPNPWGLAQSGKRFLILASPRGDVAYLVDVEDGEVTDLLDLDDDIRVMYSGQFSPDDGYLALLADADLWLIPTADPDDARRLGDGQVFSASFSSDGKQIAYVQRDEGEFQVVVEQVDGSGSEVVEEGERIFACSFVPGQQQLVLVREDEVSLLSLRDGREQELLEFEGQPAGRPWFSPNGRMMLFGYQGEDENVWHFVDLKTKTEEELRRLEGYFARFANREHRWLFFREDLAIGDEIDFAALDLESGEVQRIRDLDDETFLFNITDLSADGELALITGQTDEGMQAWLLDAKEGEARLLVEGWVTGGSLSADGRWYVYSSREDREDIESELMLLDIARDETKSLGMGVRPIWVRP